MEHRHVFFISDSTGLTAESLGNALLAQFDNVDFSKVYLPYTDTLDKARDACQKIAACALSDGAKPLVFQTILNRDIRLAVSLSEGVQVDILGTFLPSLESELGALAAIRVGKSHSNPAEKKAERRIDAINFALDMDDGRRINKYDQADVILVGVSRSAKTPTSLYIAMQFGLYVANYPLTEEDLEKAELPRFLVEQRAKLFGLTITPERLSKIRNERKEGSRYASLKQCQWEAKEAQILYRKYAIPDVETTHLSVEEIATQILLRTDLKRRV